MTRYSKLLAAFFIAAMLGACGGGGGSPGTIMTGTGSVAIAIPAPGPTALVADMAIYTDKTTIANSGTDKVTVTVIAVNASRNALPGATVTVSTDKNSIFAPAGTATDATGTYSGALTIGSDRTNRLITITATANGITKQITVQVADIASTGPAPVSVADFALLTDKSSITNNGTDVAVLTVVTVDANRNVVAGAAVSVAVGQNAIFTPTSITNLTNAAGIFTGTVSSGSDKTFRTIIIQVTVNGVVKQITLDVVPPVVVIPTTPGAATTTTPTTPVGPVVVPVTDIV